MSKALYIFMKYKDNIYSECLRTVAETPFLMICIPMLCNLSIAFVIVSLRGAQLLRTSAETPKQENVRIYTLELQKFHHLH